MAYFRWSISSEEDNDWKAIRKVVLERTQANGPSDEVLSQYLGLFHEYQVFKRIIISQRIN